ncbi:cysteine proteinase [Rhodocollybia butyracea]|uniref:ubiquitinyl hydrolase 1 n=1 Tax=Rhodocollybia butyracea TaxID=206335 RepID=A0A9P5UDQ9_9AGAR|nr:cysteine proteinase [Rhodocollybia butyracea]
MADESLAQSSPAGSKEDGTEQVQTPKHPVEITEDTDISTLSAAQVYELNQARNLLDLTADVHRPLIDRIVPISQLRAEYERGSPSFVQQINYLESQGYSSLRRTRGDGDCFYRSVAFAYVEKLLHASDPSIAVASALSTLEATPQILESVGFEKMVFEDFYEVLEQLVKNVVSAEASVFDQKLTDEMLLDAFQSPEKSNSIVVYMRMLASAQIRLDPDNFAPFLFHPELGEMMEVREFCEHFVDATGKEADHVQMTALSRILRLNIDVAYLDGRGSTGQVEFVKFQPGETTEVTASSPICLLYRPGHYDILVKSVR